MPYGSRRQTCPVRAWRDWLAASALTDGPAWPLTSSNAKPGHKTLTVLHGYIREAPCSATTPPHRSDCSGLTGISLLKADLAGLPPRKDSLQSGPHLGKPRQGEPRRGGADRGGSVTERTSEGHTSPRQT